MRLRAVVLALVVFLPGALCAQTIAIRAGHLIDPATGKVADNQIILVRDTKIVAVGSQVAAPKEAEVIDLSHSWVLPGLMDAHTHLTLNMPPIGLTAWEYTVARETSAHRALLGVRNARLVLEAGFTVIRDVGNSANYADTDLRRAIEKGWFPGPTVVNCGKIIAPFGGQFRVFSPEQGRFWQYEYIDADTPEEVRRGVRQNVYYGATAIKLVSENYPYFSEEDVRAAVEEARHAGLTVAVHAYGGEAARNAILAGADSIEHGFELSDELLALMKQKGTVLVGTDFPLAHLEALGPIGRQTPKELSEKIIDRLRRAYRAGVKVAFGTDTVADLPGKTRADMMLDYLGVWMAAGVPPAEILKAMTTNAAELFRLQKERGAIAPGLAADIIAVPENPLEDIQALHKVNFVMKDGAVIRRPK